MTNNEDILAIDAAQERRLREAEWARCRVCGEDRNEDGTCPTCEFVKGV